MSTLKQHQKKKDIYHNQVTFFQLIYFSFTRIKILRRLAALAPVLAAEVQGSDASSRFDAWPAFEDATLADLQSRIERHHSNQHSCLCPFGSASSATVVAHCKPESSG